ncbi:hypothetical protein Tco_0932424 [Tanacetum coccineum]
MLWLPLKLSYEAVTFPSIASRFNIISLLHSDCKVLLTHLSDLISGTIQLDRSEAFITQSRSPSRIGGSCLGLLALASVACLSF